MIDNNCPCLNKIEFTDSDCGVEFCIYNNTLDFDCSKCDATKQDKADAIFMIDQMERSLKAKRKRR